MWFYFSMLFFKYIYIAGKWQNTGIFQTAYTVFLFQKNYFKFIPLKPEHEEKSLGEEKAGCNLTYLGDL